MDQTQLLKNGFQVFSKAMPNDLLQQWRSIVDVIENNALDLHTKGSALEGACIVEDSVGARLIRLDNLFYHYPNQLLCLLSMAPLLELIKEIVGPHAVFTQCDLLIKHQHPHPTIRWHQDAPHSRAYPYLNIGIYLDDANLDDGCLMYVPGTQYQLQPINEIEEKYGWNPPGVVQQPAKAGDILVQDMMVLHGSGPRRTEGKRRTIYLEVRPIEAFNEENVDPNWLTTRRYWTGKILEFDRTGVYSEAERTYFVNHLSTEEIIERMKALRVAPIPATYGFDNKFAKGYPIPCDLASF
ncbi:MAG: phytanoyl-CoA dioxygenase [Cytophagales bacterium CG12_big_fil_rev_8_21_14_0_65_40_12]|nr:MAG: phytanoyl-CoA dioxygenase [Cytophagales bacterium CG12_big_fil_rev_8_21_14_0_65_40_12]PIW04829.1 MAG: phytanoyl-CoA dioxygenase [Cytophagales bacterium CG17_big_fil_post_rev_8_21_14_2_50_40_13]